MQQQSSWWIGGEGVFFFLCWLLLEHLRKAERARKSLQTAHSADTCPSKNFDTGSIQWYTFSVEFSESHQPLITCGRKLPFPWSVVAGSRSQCSHLSLFSSRRARQPVTQKLFYGLNQQMNFLIVSSQAYKIPVALLSPADPVSALGIEALKLVWKPPKRKVARLLQTYIDSP